MSQSATKSMAKNFSWSMLGSAVGGTLNFLAIIYLARVLGAAAFGWFTFAQAFLVYFVLLVDSGLSMFGMREIARSRDSAGSVVLNLFALRILAASILFLLASIVVLLLPVSAELRLFFLATFLFVFYRALNADWVFQGLERMEFNALAKIIYASLSFSLIVVFVRSASDLAKAPLIQALCGILVTIAFFFFLARFILSLRGLSVTPSRWWSYFVQALPLGVSVILIQIYANFDTIMLGFMDKPVVVGYYNAAYRIFNILVGGFALWQSTALPIMSRRLAEDIASAQNFIKQYLRLSLLLIIPLTLAVFLAAPVIINVIFGLEYQQAFLALQILIWNLIILTVGSVYSATILIPAGRYKRFLLAVAVGAVVNIALNFILIPPFSFVGAAVATLVAEISSATISFFFARQVLRLPLAQHLWKPVLFSFVAMLVFVLSVTQLPVSNYILRYVLALGAYASVCGLLILAVEREFITKFAIEIFRSKQ